MPRAPFSLVDPKVFEKIPVEHNWEAIDLKLDLEMINLPPVAKTAMPPNLARVSRLPDEIRDNDEHRNAA